MLFTLFTAAAIAIIAGFAIREVVFYARRTEVYKQRRLTLRLSMAGMLIYLLAAIYVGVRFFGLEKPVGFDRYWIAFWGFVTMLTFAILCLVLADLRVLGEEAQVARRDLAQELAETLAAHQRKKDE